MRATLQGPGTITLRATAGVLTVGHSTRENPYRGFQVALDRVEQPMPLVSEPHSHLDQLLQPGAQVHVSFDISSEAEHATESLPQLDAGVERELRKQLESLDRSFSRRKPGALPPPPEPSDPLLLAPCSHCLLVASPSLPPTTIGTSWHSHAIVTVSTERPGDATFRLELAGYDGDKRYTWGTTELALGDRLTLTFLENQQPSPARLVPPDPHLHQRFAQALHTALSRAFRGSEPKQS